MPSCCWSSAGFSGGVWVLSVGVVSEAVWVALMVSYSWAVITPERSSSSSRVILRPSLRRSGSWPWAGFSPSM